MRDPLAPEDIIHGGCPDGFWARANCDRAASLGLCSMVTMVDNRDVAGQVALATAPKPQATGAHFAPLTPAYDQSTACPKALRHDEGERRDGKCVWCGEKFRRAQDKRVTAAERIPDHG